MAVSALVGVIASFIAVWALGFKLETMSLSEGTLGGTKEVVFKVSGDRPYGAPRRESGGRRRRDERRWRRRRLDRRLTERPERRGPTPLPDRGGIARSVAGRDDRGRAGRARPWRR